MDTPTLLRTTQSLGITTALLMSGMNFISSYLFIPSLLAPNTASTSALSPHASAHIFAHIYQRGAPILVPLALSCAALNALNAYLVPSQRVVYGSAALAAAGTMAWTGVVMLPGINRLLRISEREAEGQEEKREEVRELMRAWERQNYGRAGLGFVAGVLGVWGALW